MCDSAATLRTVRYQPQSVLVCQFGDRDQVVNLHSRSFRGASFFSGYAFG